MKRVYSCLAMGCLLGLGILATPAPVAAEACPACDDIPKTICSDQGFEIELLAFAINQNAGTSTWDYKVCNNVSGTCPPPKDLSHFNLDLPALGECLTETQNVSFSHQITHSENTSAAVLACGVSHKDPSCFPDDGEQGIDFMAKCDVVGPDLEPGKCVVARLTIAGEKPTLGPGAAQTVTKAGRFCASNCILGPSCDSCLEPPQPDECLTRSAGFWGTHPHITNLFLPVTVCGKPLTRVDAGFCDSVSEALCVAPGVESKSNRAYAQLVRQLTAAKLNFKASSVNGGSCDPVVQQRIGQCEALCGNDHATISASGCIEDLTAFNESLDSFSSTPPPFDSPGPAQPMECNKANGNGRVIGKGVCSAP